MPDKKQTMQERLDDLPTQLNDKQKFERYYQEYEKVYDETPDYKSDKYCQFVIAMQLIKLNDRLFAWNYQDRKRRGELSEEELSDIEKYKKFDEES
jgi:hypothetical protein